MTTGQIACYKTGQIKNSQHCAYKKLDTLPICAYDLAYGSRLRPDQEREEHQRGHLSFERAKEVDFNTALVFPDTRKSYGETRYIALCYLDRRLHVLCFTETETGIRVISFRKANAREAIRYGKPQTLD